MFFVICCRNIFLDNFELLLATGGFARVYLALKGGKKFAIKMVSYMSDNDKKVADSEERCFVLLKDSSPYIVNFFESFTDVSVIILFVYY
jgi:serine/threonine protein kinase